MNEFLNNFHFLRPQLFWLFLPAVFFIYCLFHAGKDNDWKKLISPILLEHLNIQHQKLSRLNQIVFSSAALLMAITALAGPSWQKQQLPVTRNDHALIIVLDLTLSMLAEDVKPSRLVRARQKINDIMNIRKEGTTALVVYSGDAHRVVPLSEDRQNINSLLAALHPEMMPVIGSRPELAIEQAIQLLKDAKLNQGDVLMLSDDIEDEQIALINNHLSNENIRFSVIAVGTEQGAPIILPDGTHLKDPYGQTVIATTNVKNLKKLASENHGVFRTLALNNSDIEHLLDFGFSEESLSAIDRQHNQWKDAGIYLVLLLLPFSLLFFRRGIIIVLFVIPIINSKPVYAEENKINPPYEEQQLSPSSKINPNSWWNKLWYNANQRGEMAFKNNDLSTAAETFKHSQWQASTQFRQGDYQSAASLFEKDSSVEGLYNHATALAKSGEFERAIDEYQQVLNRNPNHTDAETNKRIVEELLKQQQNENNEHGESQQNNNQQQDSQQQESQQTNPNDSSDQQSQSEQSSSEQQDHQSNQEQQSQQESQNSPEASEQNSEQSEQQGSESSKDQADEQQQKPTANKMEDQQNGKPANASLSEQQKMDTAEEQKAKVWLEQIPDDPSGLLRRKFQYESRVKEGGRHIRQEGKLW